MESEKKKRPWLRDVLVVVGGMLGVGGVIWLLRKFFAVSMGLILAAMMFYYHGDMDELLFTTVSPGGTHSLEIYRVNPGATEPYYIRADVLEKGEKRRTVYNVRGQSEAEIVWQSDTEAEINGVPVDVTSGECFKVNALGYFYVEVDATAVPEAKYLQLTVFMDGEERTSQRFHLFHTGEDGNLAYGKLWLYVLKELHWDDDLTKEKAGLTVTVETADGQRIVLPYRWEWKAKEYGRYTFVLTGSEAEGYALTPQKFACTVTPVGE